MPKSLLLGLVLWLASAGTGAVERIAIIGTGDVGSTLGLEFAEQGYEIVYGSRSPQGEQAVSLVNKIGVKASAAHPNEAVKGAGIVVLAVPGLLVEEITRSLGDLSGKIIIDPTNPLIGWEKGDLRLREGISNAALIQKAAPQAQVVKAFSTLNVQQMRNPEKSSGPISVILVGDSHAAKQKVAQMAHKMGLSPIDLGNLSAAKYVEGMSILLLNNRIQGRERFDFYLQRD